MPYNEITPKSKPLTRSRFETQLVCSKTTAHEWTVYEPLVYHSRLFLRCGMSTKIEVPFGFSTDFASVPRILWNLFPPDGSYTPAAVVHDWLYRKTVLPRSLCDAVFLEAMKVCGTPWHERTIMWLAVRLCGWAARKRVPL